MKQTNPHIVKLQRNSTSTQDEVIYPTFTEIDWQTQMEEMQRETLEKCRKLTQEMIQEAKKTISSELNTKIEHSIVQSNQKFDMMMDMMKEMSRSITEGFQNQANRNKENQSNEKRAISLRPHSPLIETEKRKLENGKDKEQKKK